VRLIGSDRATGGTGSWIAAARRGVLR
jgi:hypothetical protein